MATPAPSYHLRVQKEIERRLFLDALSFVDRLRPIRDAVYIGMGSVYFEDFKAMHDRFGTGRMICLEQEEWLQKRQKFNLPLSPSCIELPECSVDEFLVVHDFDGARNHVVWLDFEGFHPDQHLSTFASFLGKLRQWDVAKITLDASNAKLRKQAGDRAKIPAHIPKEREKIVREKLGDYFPAHRADDVVNWLGQKKLGRVLMEAAIVAADKGVAPGLQFVPLTAILYADQAEMLTLTGIVSKSGDDAIRELEMEEFPFVYRKGEGPFRITPLPIMTPREKMAVDRHLPLPSIKGQVAKAHKSLVAKGVQFDVNEEESLKRLEKYAELYRYHPDYRKISP